MASTYQTFVNTELVKRIGYGTVPASGNATAGTIPQFTGVGLTIAEAAYPTGGGGALTIPSTNGAYAGTYFSGSFTAVTVAGYLVYLNSDGTYHLAYATGPSPIAAVGMAVSIGTPLIMSTGFFCNTAWSWTPGALLYLSDTTPGLMTVAQPTVSGYMVQPVGYAYNATTVYFSPSLMYMVLL